MFPDLTQAIVCFRGDQASLRKYPEPLKVLEGMVAAVHSNVQLGSVSQTRDLARAPSVALLVSPLSDVCVCLALLQRRRRDLGRPPVLAAPFLRRRGAARAASDRRAANLGEQLQPA